MTAGWTDANNARNCLQLPATVLLAATNRGSGWSGERAGCGPRYMYLNVPKMSRRLQAMDTEYDIASRETNTQQRPRTRCTYITYNNGLWMEISDGR